MSALTFAELTRTKVQCCEHSRRAARPSRPVSTTCSSCGEPILWAVTEAGKRMPVDPKSEKRLILEPNGHSPEAAPRARMVDTYVSHFVTCVSADQHRRK